MPSKFQIICWKQVSCLGPDVHLFNDECVSYIFIMIILLFFLELFNKVSENDVFQACPSSIDFHGYEIGKTSKQTLVSHEHYLFCVFLYSHVFQICRKTRRAGSCTGSSLVVQSSTCTS